jgi:hypothetical protein
LPLRLLVASKSANGCCCPVISTFIEAAASQQKKRPLKQREVVFSFIASNHLLFCFGMGGARCATDEPATLHGRLRLSKRVNAANTQTSSLLLPFFFPKMKFLRVWCPDVYGNRKNAAEEATH